MINLNDFWIPFLFGFAVCLCIVLVPFTYLILREISFRKYIADYKKQIKSLEPQVPQGIDELEKTIAEAEELTKKKA